jgi:hypothetical protein
VYTVGSHIRVYRRLQGVGPRYWHHGIVTAVDTVVEFGGGSLRAKHETEVRRVPLASFGGGEQPEVVAHPITWSGITYSSLLPPEQVVDRAEWLLRNQPPPYHLGFRNCESIAIWCATGDYETFQVKRFIRARLIVSVPLLLAAQKRPKALLAFGLVGGAVSLLTAVPYMTNREFFDHTRRYPGIGNWDRSSTS